MPASGQWMGVGHMRTDVCTPAKACMYTRTCAHQPRHVCTDLCTPAKRDLEIIELQRCNDDEANCARQPDVVDGGTQTDNNMYDTTGVQTTRPEVLDGMNRLNIGGCRPKIFELKLGSDGRSML